MNMRLLFIVFCLSGFWIHAQAIEWMTFEQALEAQKETPKKYWWMSIPTGVARVN